MKAVRHRDDRIIVHAEALYWLLDQFRPHMIRAIVELVEFATTHPEYDQRFPELSTWLDADVATDILIEFFSDLHDAPDDPVEAPVVTVNGRRGTITLHAPKHTELPPAPEGGEWQVGPLIPPDILDGPAPPALPEVPPALDGTPGEGVPQARLLWRNPRRRRGPQG